MVQGEEILNLPNKAKLMNYVDSIQCSMFFHPHVRALIGGGIDYDDDILDKEEK